MNHAGLLVVPKPGITAHDQSPMKPLSIRITVFASILCLGGCTAFVEEPAYKSVSEEGAFEVRDYPRVIVAETTVDATLEEAGGEAFERLFGYISGDNVSDAEIAMTSPVTQTGASESISMTAPVGQTKRNGGWVVSFIMPASYTLESLPKPTDPKVALREVPSRRIAVIRYSGTWSAERYRDHLEKLESWMDKQRLEASGDPIWARYNPPFTPWFLRRNEIMIPVAGDSSGVE